MLADQRHNYDIIFKNGEGGGHSQNFNVKNDIIFGRSLAKSFFGASRLLPPAVVSLADLQNSGLSTIETMRTKKWWYCSILE